MADTPKKRVFITGATGFVGAYILRQLVAAGHEVRALRRSTQRMELVQDIADRVEWIEGDILEIPVLEDAMVGIDEVYHAAAMVSFDPRDRKAMYRVNVEGTTHVVNVALYRGVKKLGYVSSIAAVGRSAQSPIVDETTRWENSKVNTHYAISKYQAEREVWRGTAEGLPAVIVNPTIVVGAGRWGETSCKFFPQIDNGLKYYTSGSGGFVDVRDVAEVLFTLMEGTVQNERFVLVGENMPYLQFFEAIAAALDRKPPHIKATPLMKEVVWRVEWLRAQLTGQRPLITRETARTSSHHFEYRNDKAREQLGFTFRSIAETVAETAAAYQASQAQGRDYAVF